MIYAIGDVQGCYQSLLTLVELIEFDPKQDQLWFCGDLVNRGPDSLNVLRFVKNLGDRAVTVLGNHDLHLLAVAIAGVDMKKKDTFQDVLNAPDCHELCDWLRQQKLIHHHDAIDFTLVHAGIPPQWTIHEALQHAKEVETLLQSTDHCHFLKNLYGDEPHQWQHNLNGDDRFRLITNYFTRMRFCAANGSLDLKTKGGIDDAASGYFPWFKVPERCNKGEKIVFGHWAALEGKVDTRNVFALDTGCAWGQQLSALRLDDQQWFRVNSQEMG